MPHFRSDEGISPKLRSGRGRGSAFTIEFPLAMV